MMFQLWTIVLNLEKNALPHIQTREVSNHDLSLPIRTNIDRLSLNRITSTDYGKIVIVDAYYISLGGVEFSRPIDYFLISWYSSF